MTVLFADDQNTTIIVLGASGDLAFKKTYPALYGLFYYDMLPKSFQIVGYARSEITITDFKQRVSSKIKGDLSKLTEFLDACFYVSGKYDEDSSFQKLNGVITRLEESSNTRIKNRVFYMALPPSVFIPASNGLKKNCYISNPHTNRIVVEKPFGKDLDSSRELSSALASCWSEDEIYRIDHYLGKEMVKNLMTLRFSNMIVGSIWNKSSIHNVQITFKEPIGTEGRGGYFDEFGIIRDVFYFNLDYAEPSFSNIVDCCNESS